MPLTMLTPGKEAIIRECRASEDTRKFLEGLGIVPGTPVTVISEMDGNLIIKVKEARVALSKGVAGQVYIRV